jgi:GTP:adenosylcobinamide-phosphate guanylyltransferase
LSRKLIHRVIEELLEKVEKVLLALSDNHSIPQRLVAKEHPIEKPLVTSGPRRTTRFVQ